MLMLNEKDTFEGEIVVGRAWRLIFGRGRNLRGRRRGDDTFRGARHVAPTVTR